MGNQISPSHLSDTYAVRFGIEISILKKNRRAASLGKQRITGEKNTGECRQEERRGAPRKRRGLLWEKKSNHENNDQSGSMHIKKKLKNRQYQDMTCIS